MVSLLSLKKENTLFPRYSLAMLVLWVLMMFLSYGLYALEIAWNRAWYLYFLPGRRDCYTWRRLPDDIWRYVRFLFRGHQAYL